LARKILLADDSVTAQNMGRKILVDAGYEVVTVNNGSAALKRVNESKPDLVVLDVYMPGYSGLEVCQRLKEASETAHIPVLLTVGKLEPFKPDEARRVRADAHIVKPFEASELLSALARLEDRIVSAAEQQKLNRKAPGDNGSAKTVANGSDTSWRERLRFPAKKKEKKEAETEPADVTANFHDFRRSKAKTVSESPTAAKSAVTEKESVVVPDLPRDITADELDALSAVAASLESSTPPERTAPAAGSQPAESQAAQTQAAETPSTEVVNIASLAQEPAPIDQQDEPIFATEPAAQEKVEATAAEAVAASEQIAAAQQPEVKAEEAQLGKSIAEATGPEELKSEQSRIEETTVQEFKVQKSNVQESRLEESTPGESPLVASLVDAPITDETTAPIVEEQTGFVEPAPSPASTEVSVQAAAEPEDPPPSDEELAQALRLLTPAPGYSDTPMPSHGTLVAAGHLLAEEAARHAASQPRWIAESVALTPEEASISLEAEMFGKFVADAAAEITAPAVSQVATSIEVLSGAVAESAPLYVAEKDVEPVLETPVPEIAQEMGQHVSAATLPDEAPGQAPAATFADVAPQEATVAPETIAEEMIAQGAVEQAAQIHASKLEASAAPGSATEVAHEDSSPDAGGPTEMGKRGKQTSDKSKKHQTVEPTPQVPAAEAVMQAETPETPKTMAAAASADGASTVAPDASAIASIVESVLADLRPKIVEEITRKLARK
jgi:CheY-like chemotaxis protein